MARHMLSLSLKVRAEQGSWEVWDGGQWDNSLFGLWHSTVGEDVQKNDMFENIE